MLTRYLFTLICICVVVVSGCDSKAPAQSSPRTQATADTATESADTSVESAPTVSTLAADVRGSDDAGATGTIVLVSDAEALVLGSALDGLSAGKHALSFAASAVCEDVLGQPTASAAIAEFTTSVHGQGKFSKTLNDAGPLPALLGQSLLVSRVDAEDAAVVIACGELRAIVR